MADNICVALSAGQMCIFDPTGCALGNGKGDGNGSAKAFSYAQGDLSKRFTDQFAPFVAAGLDLDMETARASHNYICSAVRPWIDASSAYWYTGTL